MLKVTSENALEMGKAAEHLVCADLILSGYRAFLSDQGLPYDVVLDLDGHLIRIQVKSSGRRKNVNVRGAARHAYVFHARRRGKCGVKRLTNAQCDILAFVALDIGAVAYIPVFEVRQTCILNPPGRMRPPQKRSAVKHIDEYPIAAALEKALRHANRHKQPT